MDKVKLNLGCGCNVREGFMNYDMFPVDDRVLPIDLNCLPLPFDDGSVDHIVLHQVLEHLNVSPYDFMMDVYRILKKDGVIQVSLPVYCHTIEHNRYRHHVNYFDSLCVHDPKASDRFTNSFFRLNKLCKKRRSLRSVLLRFVEMFKDCFYIEYEYELVKNK